MRYPRLPLTAAWHRSSSSTPEPVGHPVHLVEVADHPGWHRRCPGRRTPGADDGQDAYGIYAGGTRACVDRILTSELEALEVGPDTRMDPGPF